MDFFTEGVSKGNQKSLSERGNVLSNMDPIPSTKVHFFSKFIQQIKKKNKPQP